MAKTAAALHILVKEEKLALDLLEQIKNGADFGKLAKKHSICPSGKRGGDLGEFRQGQMVPAFDKVVFSCPVLEPTGPLHTGFAPIFPDICYHLTHYKPAAADIPVASDNPAHYADAIRYNARTPLQGSLLPLTRLVWA